MSSIKNVAIEFFLTVQFWAYSKRDPPIRPFQQSLIPTGQATFKEVLNIFPIGPYVKLCWLMLAQFWQRTISPKFGLIGQVCFRFLNGILLNFLYLATVAILVGVWGHQTLFWKGAKLDHPCQDWSNLAQWFQKSWLKNAKSWRRRTLRGFKSSHDPLGHVS